MQVIRRLNSGRKPKTPERVFRNCYDGFLPMRRFVYRCLLMRVRTLIWISLTAIYIYALLVVILFRFDEFCSLSLNEAGDFFAGAFGPLALAWLIFGYFQQGDELRQGTEALLMQAKELKSSVEQQTAMVDAQELSVRNHERSLEPLLRLSHKGNTEIEGDFYDSFMLQNFGHYCESIVVCYSTSCGKSGQQNLQPLFGGDTVGFYLDEFEGSCDLNVSYKRINGSGGAQSFKLKHYFDEMTGPDLFVEKLPFVV